MDELWFKSQQKRAGVNAKDIADICGKDRSVVSKIYKRKQPMTMEWARAFSKALNVSVADVLEHAGITTAAERLSLPAGFSDGEAAPWHGPEIARNRIAPMVTALGGGRPGVDVWQIMTDSLWLHGLLKGDFCLVDTHLSERTRAGDLVMAQVYEAGGATTVVRRHEPPVLIKDTTNPRELRVRVVDNVNVVILGKIIASWRQAEAAQAALPAPT